MAWKTFPPQLEAQPTQIHLGGGQQQGLFLPYLSPMYPQAQSFCQSRKMAMVSLDDVEKTKHLMALLAEDSQPFFWTGGLLDEHKL